MLLSTSKKSSDAEWESQYGTCYLKALVLVRCDGTELGRLRQEDCQKFQAYPVLNGKLKVSLDYIARSCLKRKYRGLERRLMG